MTSIGFIVTCTTEESHVENGRREKGDGGWGGGETEVRTLNTHLMFIAP